MSFHGSDLTRVTVSSRVNEVFTQLVHVFIFCYTQEETNRRFVAHALCQFEHARSPANHSRNLATLFLVLLEQVPYVPSHSPCGCLPQGVVVLFVGSLASSTLSGNIL